MEHQDGLGPAVSAEGGLGQEERVVRDSAFVDALSAELGKVLVGQNAMLERLLIGLLGNGHILLEGVPGLAKTLAIKSLAQAFEADFSRIQFTPDLLPSDLIGTQIYNVQNHSFEVKKGPVFAHFVLADEINRAPAKVQSALLEAMQEKQITIGDQTFPLPRPFLVLATQNPLEQEGTYPLPEAQLDRFLLKTVIDYPSLEEEREIVRRQINDEPLPIRPVVGLQTLEQAKQSIRNVYLDAKIETYILDLVQATRHPERYKLQRLQPLIACGASPRASINLAKAARVLAFIRHRSFVIPEDVRNIAGDVLRHRIALTYEAEAENIKAQNIIDDLLHSVEVP
ncbi:AAA domain-containing protein [bacterium]|nr:AAA domain-containing protein [bacterium]